MRAALSVATLCSSGQSVFRLPVRVAIRRPVRRDMILKRASLPRFHSLTITKLRIEER